MAITNFEQACQVLALGKPLYGFYIRMNRLGSNSTRFDRNIRPTQVSLSSHAYLGPLIVLKDYKMDATDFNCFLEDSLYESLDEAKLGYNNKIEELREESKRLTDSFFDKYRYTVKT